MSPLKSQFRYFLAYQDPRQEAWLEAQALEGWHLTRPGRFAYSFVQGEPRADRYRMDYQVLRGEKRADYLALFRDAGWEFLGEVTNRYYFRARPEALSPEIFSDAESRRDRIRRELRFLGVFLGLLAWNVSTLGTKVAKELQWEGWRPVVHNPMDWIFPPVLLLCALLTLLGMWCVWKLARALR
jgi:hypothetical protein